MAGEDGKSAVHLFGKYDPGQLMWQGHAAEGKDQVGSLACNPGPPISGPDGEHQALNPLVADSPDIRGELIGGVLLPVAIQQNGIGWSAAGLTVQPLQERSLGVEELRVARGVTRSPLHIVGEQALSSLGF